MIKFLLLLLLLYVAFYLYHLLYFFLGWFFCSIKKPIFGTYLLALSIAGDLFNIWSKKAGKLLVKYCTNKTPTKCRLWSCPYYWSCKDNDKNNTK